MKTRTWWPHTKRMVWFLVALGGLMATPMEVLASDPFDINALSVDEENRFSNVGAFDRCRRRRQRKPGRASCAL